MSITGGNTAEITGRAITTTSGDTYEFISMQYVYVITSPSSYSGYYLWWSTTSGIYFPCTLTKFSSGAASTSSVKNTEMPVPVLSVTKSAKVL